MGLPEEGGGTRRAARAREESGLEAPAGAWGGAGMGSCKAQLRCNLRLHEVPAGGRRPMGSVPRTTLLESDRRDGEVGEAGAPSVSAPACGRAARMGTGEVSSLEGQRQESAAGTGKRGPFGFRKSRRKGERGRFHLG